MNQLPADLRVTMHRKAVHALAAVAALAICGQAAAQLTVNPQTDLQQLARTITGPGVSISNPQINCHGQGFGQFQYAGSVLGIDEGILLTTGTINNAQGPNNVENKTFAQNFPGSTILNQVSGKTTYDACMFQFDVIPGGDNLRFDFVFGSEEYNEYVGSQYNDVFGFFISGPGITGDPGIGSDKNIALVPGTNQAVTINNVNNGSNASRYFDNAGGQHLQYDGITRGLSAQASVQPCQSYHLKLIVADASDKKYDSGVFIAKVKSNPVTMQLITANGADSLIEGCNNGVVRFTRQSVTNQPLVLQYFLLGTATNGVDYEAIGDPSPSAPKTITIPANLAYVDQPITTIADGMPEGLETILFILGNPFCPDTGSDTLVVKLADEMHAAASPASSMICSGGQVQLTASGGTQYSWAPGLGLSSASSSSPMAYPATTTTYSVTVSRGGCNTQKQVEVKVSTMQASTTITRPLCNGASNGALGLSVSGGIPPYSYQWTGPNGFSATTKDLSFIPAGTYTVIITDAACSKTFSFQVGQPAPLSVSLTPSLLVFGQNISCAGGHDGSIASTTTGGTGPYSAAWAGPGGFTSTLPDIGGLGEGAYSLTMTDANGCTATAGTTLLASAPMASAITQTTHVACANDGTGSATVAVTGGMPVYNYAWNTTPVQATATATGLAPGTYQVTASDQYGCSTVQTVTISGPLQPLATQLTSLTHVSCHGASGGQAAISISGGTPAYAISWNTMPPQLGYSATGLAGGTYTATVTDANGCQTTRQVAVNEPAAPLIVAATAQQNVTCAGQSTGSATVAAAGGTAPYAYTWNTTPAHNGASITGLAADTYTVTATDGRGCSAGLNVVITGPSAALTTTISASTDVLCAGGSTGSATALASGGTGPYTYQWNTTPQQGTATATGLAAGSWQVSIWDANQCHASATVAISQPSPLAATGAVIPAQCLGALNGAVDLTTSGGAQPYHWAWSGPNGFTATTEDLSGLAAGGYSVTITDANGCTATQSFNVNQPGLFQVTATPSVFGNSNVSCPGSMDGSINLSVSGAVPPYAYAWSGPAGFNSAQKDLSGLLAGTYQATITDANGCSTSLDVALQAPAPTTALLTAGNHGGTGVSCSGGADGSISTLISGGTAPYNTSWNGPGGYTSSTASISGLAAGNYQLTITDANGCPATQQATITQPAALAVANGGTSPVSCFGSNTGQATVSVSGGRSPYSYTWNTTPQQHAATASGLAAANYTATVTDANGCTSSISIPVAGPSAPLSATASATGHVLCPGGNQGAALAQATGGTPPYSYSWNTVPQVSSSSITGLTAGTWTVTVTDAAGCSTARNIVITQPAQALAAQVANQQPASCFGMNDGSASLSVTGGSGQYSTVWNTVPTQFGSTATHLSPGQYTATITDLNGCPQALIISVYISGPSAPLAVSMMPFTYFGGAHVSCPGSQDGSIQLSIAGGTPGYQCHWQDGQGHIYSTQNPTGLGAGQYLLSITDGHGCTLDTSINLAAAAGISATTVVQPAVCHGGNTGAVQLTPLGGAAPYSFHWTGPGGFSATSRDLSQLYAGIYTTTITDINGCALQQPVDVTEPGTFSFIGTTTAATCANASNGSVQLTASGGTAPYQFAWSGPGGFTANTQGITGLASGIYHLALTDANGCSALYSSTVSAPSPLVAFTISHKNHGGYDVSCNGASDGAVSTTYSGGTPPYTFSWSGPNGFTAHTPDLSNLAAGSYTLTVTDANGCMRTAGTTLMAPPPLLAAATTSSFAGGFGTSCSGASDGSITIAPAGGVPAYHVAWAGPGGYSSTSWQITGLHPGTYTAIVTDGNGCAYTTAATLTAPAPITLTANATDVSCNGGATGDVQLQANGGSGMYTYQWSGPNAFASQAQHINGLVAGTYTVHVADGNGCTAQATVTLAQPDAITPTASTVTTQCQGANSGSIHLAVGGGTGGYTYLWTGFPAFSAATRDIDNLFAGVYTVAITDAAGCTTTAAYNVGEPGQFDITAELSQWAGGYNVSCPAATDGSITATVTGGTGPYSYFWNGPNGFTAIGLAQSGLSSGEYHLVVHDANGCNSGADFTLVAPDVVQVGLIATAQPSCQGGQDGSIQTGIMGGSAPYSCTWDGPNGPIGISQNLTGVGAGTYSVTVTDALGCTRTASITLTSPAGITASAIAQVQANGTNLSCASAADGSISLHITGGNAPYQVTWSGPGGFLSNNRDIAGLAPGTYTASITDANGCGAVAQATLTAPAPLVPSLATSVYSNGNGISCAGADDGSITLALSGGTPGYTIMWQGPGGFSSSTTTLHGLEPGPYNVQITDAAGCMASATALLSAPAPITVSATVGDHGGFDVGCNGNDGSISLVVGGGLAPYQYSWTGPDGFASGDAVVAGLTAGTYQVAITDANGCHADRSITLHASPPLATLLVVTSNECDATSNGEIAQVVSGGTAPFIFQWTGPNGFASTDKDITGLSSGVYSVTVTSAIGCTTSQHATVIAAAPMSLSLYAAQYGQTNIPCHGGQTGLVELSVAGGFAPLQIAWAGPNGFSASTAHLQDLAAGPYSVLITDGHGCMRDTAITLTEPAISLTTTFSSTEVACHGQATGTITATVDGGVAPYTYTWRGPDNSAFSTHDISSLAAGDYELVVTDANQCIDTLHATIHQPDSAMLINYTMGDHHGYATSCPGANDGTLQVLVSGGTPLYSCSWTGPGGFSSQQNTLTGLSAGTYVLQVTDAHGCLQEQEITLDPPPAISLSLTASAFPSGSAISCFGALDGSISTSFTGGVAPLQLLWSGPGGFSSIEGSISALPPGSYCITASDANGCQMQDCITLTEPAQLTASAASSPAYCGQSIGTVDGSATGGSAPYGYSWSNGETSAHLAGLPPGTYTLSVADANGCTATAEATVAGTPAVEANAQVELPLCHGSSDGAIATIVTSGTAPYTYTWSTGATAASLSSLHGGEYTVTISDANGCTWTQAIQVAAPPPITVDTLLSHYTGGYNISQQGASNGSINLNTAGGTAPYTYAWGDGATAEQRDGLSAGSYAVTIMDANGCTLNLQFLLTQPDGFAMPTGFTPNGDGSNDAYVVHGIDAYPNNQITVFNRWGNVVFDQLRYRNDWRGENQQGEALPNGTYFVVLRLTSDLTVQNYVDLRR